MEIQRYSQTQVAQQCLSPSQYPPQTKYPRILNPPSPISHSVSFPKGPWEKHLVQVTTTEVTFLTHNPFVCANVLPVYHHPVLVPAQPLRQYWPLRLADVKGHFHILFPQAEPHLCPAPRPTPVGVFREQIVLSTFAKYN